MSRVVQKHDHDWSAYLWGAGFVAASVLFLWELLRDWARLIAR